MGGLRIPSNARGFTYYQPTPPENPAPGDTWWDTSSGMGYIYEGGWVPYKKDSTCWEKNPAYVKIEPVNQTISTDGGSVNFTVTIKNMDVGVCGNTDFTLTVHDSNTDDFEPSTLSQTTVTLGPYQSTTVTLTVTDKVGAAVGSGRNDVYVTVEATDHPTSQSNTVTVELADAAAECTRQAPSVSISPSNQTITTDGGSVSYTVTITNNDPTSCTETTFNLSVTDSNTDNFDPSTLSQTSVTLAPGASMNVTLTVKDKAGDYPGSPTSNNTYVTVTSTEHGSVNSNTVTTTIDEGAVTAGYGYVCGGHDGSNYVSTIARLDFSSESITTLTETLSESVLGANGCNSSTYMYVVPSNSDNIFRGSIPVANSFSTFGGQITRSHADCAACNSSTYGYVMGGDGGATGGSSLKAIDRFQFPFTGGTTVQVGSLSFLSSGGNTCNSSTHGYLCCGHSSGYNYESTIERIQFPFDSGTSTKVGTTTAARLRPGSFNSSTCGYICGGYYTTGSGTAFSIVDKFVFPFDSGTATRVGYISKNCERVSGLNSTTSGYTCGGYDQVTDRPISTIHRCVFATDTVSVLGSTLATPNQLTLTTDTTDFISMFV